jgi:hypothetical protein
MPSATAASVDASHGRMHWRQPHGHNVPASPVAEDRTGYGFATGIRREVTRSRHKALRPLPRRFGPAPVTDRAADLTPPRRSSSTRKSTIAGIFTPVTRALGAQENEADLLARDIFTPNRYGCGTCALYLGSHSFHDQREAAAVSAIEHLRVRYQGRPPRPLGSQRKHLNTKRGAECDDAETA